MANSHYISRFLTKPWQHGRKDLTYYDLKNKKLYTRPSKRLFAKEGLFSDELERFLNQKVEWIANKEREELASGKREYTNFRSFRAIVLLILLQGGRSAAMKQGGREFARILTFTDEQLDQLVMATLQKFRLASLTISPQRRLYYPDTGIFAALVHNAGIFEWLFCLPITSQCALTLMPVQVDPEVAGRQLTQDASLMNWSVGVSEYCERVVIHPDLLRGNSESDIAKAIEEIRGMNDEQITNLKVLNNAVDKMHAEVERIFGFQLR